MPNVIHNTRIMETASRISFEIRYTLQNLMNKTNDHRLDSYGKWHRALWSKRKKKKYRIVTQKSNSLVNCDTPTKQ